MACHIVYAVLFYELFKPVSRTLSLLAAAISLVAAAIQGSAALFQAGYLYPWYLAPDVIGEPVLMLWLLIVGLNPGAGYSRQVLHGPDEPRSLWSLRQRNGFSGAIMNAGLYDRRRSAGGPREGAGNAWNRCGRGWLT